MTFNPAVRVPIERANRAGRKGCPSAFCRCIRIQSTEPLLKLEYPYKDRLGTGNLVAKLRRSPQAPIEVISVAEGVPLNQRFAYSIHLTAAGNLTVNARDCVWTAQLDPAWRSKLLYFKAGVYTQDNTGYASEGGAATFYVLSVSHERIR